MDAEAHAMQLKQETRDGRLTGDSHVWCSCGDFDMRARSVEVARGMLGHQWAADPAPSA
jgi:hypothetical protein